MEKLILRSVMYGAEKVPDHWFEKIPGGFYKSDKTKQNGHQNGQRSSTGNDRRRSRRYSTGDGARGPPRDDHDDDKEYGEGYRSEGHRRRQDHRRKRSSYDGGDDDDVYSGEDRQRRRQHGGDRRRRRSVDDNRYGYDDGYGRARAPDDRHDGRPVNEPHQPYPEQDQIPYVPPMRQQNPFSPRDSVTGVGAAAGAAAVNAAYANGNSDPMSPHSWSPNPTSPPPESPPSRPRSGVASGYVPYSDIYGGSSQQAPRQPFSTPPSSNAGSVQPNQFNQVSRPVTAHGGYQQNPFAQQFPTAAAAGAGAAYTGQAGYIPADPRYSARHESGHDDRYNDDPDENDRSDHESPPPRRRRPRRDDSPSDYSYDSRHDASDHRRARSERRNEGGSKRAKSHGRGKSGLREKFDTSQKGLGYGAAGAIAGGLFGSEIGKGPVSMAIGATIGALGANAFQARERRKQEQPAVVEVRQTRTYARGDARRSGYYSD